MAKPLPSKSLPKPTSFLFLIFFSKSSLEKRWQVAIGSKNVSPVGLVLHVGATNTLVAGLDGLMDGLLSGNVNFYKLPTMDGGVPGIFIESIFEADVEYILINNKGKKLQPRYVYGKVKEYLSHVTTNDRKSPHILRHSFATHLTNNGADINAVKELLGHSSLASTQIYTHNSIQKLKDIHKKAHPKS